MEEMNGTPLEVLSPTKGTANGILGFDVAEVGRGGKQRMDGVSPGISKATTF